MSKPRSTPLEPILPANLPANPTYRKVNPADAPIMILGLTSDKYGPDKLYDEASTVMQQKLSQIQGVGQVNPGRRSAALCPGGGESYQACWLWHGNVPGSGRAESAEL